MSQGATPRFFHIGVCASDLERSLAFYTEALDFVVSHHVDPGAEFGALVGTHKPPSRAYFLTRGDFMIELLASEDPAEPAAGERPVKRPGLNHVSFVVDDLDALAERIARCGGRIQFRRMETPDGSLILCADPDGVQIELWRRNEPAGR